MQRSKGGQTPFSASQRGDALSYVGQGTCMPNFCSDPNLTSMSAGRGCAANR